MVAAAQLPQHSSRGSRSTTAQQLLVVAEVTARLSGSPYLCRNGLCKREPTIKRNSAVRNGRRLLGAVWVG